MDEEWSCEFGHLPRGTIERIVLVVVNGFEENMLKYIACACLSFIGISC
jgi:hypothetical protein